MPRIISMGKNGKPRSFLQNFASMDMFTKFFIVIIILLAVSTPFIVYNYQTYETRAQTQAESLREIAQLQQSQENMQNAFTGASNPTPPVTTDTAPINSGNEFNLLNFLRQIFAHIVRIF
jgi:hypothetical protein